MNPDLVYKLYEQHKVGIFRFSLSILKDAPLAEDVLQETFLRAWRKWPLRPDTEKAWLVRVAMNLCRDQQRRSWIRRIDRSIPLDDLVIPVEPVNNDVIREVYALPPKEREVIVMHYWGNLSAQEIAAALRISRASVYRTMDKVMVSTIAGAAENGLYENAEKILHVPIALISAGLLALAFMGFSGLKIF